MTRAIAFAILLTLAGASEVRAQAKPRPRTPPPPPPSRGLEIGGFGMVGMMNFTAADSFDVILGSPSGPIFGGGIRISEGGWFLDVGAWRFSGEGERVFVFEGQEFPLNIPAQIAITPVELTAGYRLRFRRFPLVRPYAGAGFSSYGYKETSAFATDNENVDERFNGFHVLGGAEVRVARWVGVSGEVAWTSVPDALGESGVSAEFGETDLGGTSIRLKVTIGR